MSHLALILKDLENILDKEIIGEKFELATSLPATISHDLMSVKHKFTSGHRSMGLKKRLFRKRKAFSGDITVKNKARMYKEHTIMKLQNHVRQSNDLDIYKIIVTPTILGDETPW